MKQVTIFEGPDGGGKSTAAALFAKVSHARLVHLGPFPRVGHRALARFYAEAMMPAVLDYQDVALDRSWLSEPIYGSVFRDGQDRVGAAHQRILERLALRAQAVVVFCLPTWERVSSTFASRRQQEMLDDEVQLGRVYRRYLSLVEPPRKESFQLSTALPWARYNYERDDFPRLIANLHGRRPAAHPVEGSAGNWDAPVWLVGESFAHHANDANLYQWPFSNFSNDGCSSWLAQQLHVEGVDEAKLGWCNADAVPALADHLRQRRVLALGNVAAAALRTSGVEHETTMHPQHWKRFHHRERYPLLDLLRQS